MSTRITAPSDHRCVICGEGVRSKRTPLLKYTEESAMHIAVENYLDQLVAFAATDWEARLRKLVLDWAPTGDYLSRVLKRCRTWGAASGALYRREQARRTGEYHVAHENCRLGAINACDMFVPYADLPRNPSKSSKPAVHEAWKRAIGAVLARPAEFDSSRESIALGAEISRLGRMLVPRPRSEAKRKGPVAARRKNAAAAAAAAAATATATPTPATRIVRASMLYKPTLQRVPPPPPAFTTAITLPIPASPASAGAPSSSSSGAGAGAVPRPRRMSVSNDPSTPPAPTTMTMMTRKRSRTDSFSNADLDADLGKMVSSGAPPVTVTVKEEPVPMHTHHAHHVHTTKEVKAEKAVMPVHVQHRLPHLQPLAPQAPTLSPQPSYTNIAGLASPSAFLTPPRPITMPMEFSHPLPAVRPPLRRRTSEPPQPLQWEVSPEILKGLENLGLDLGALTPVASG